MHRSFCVIQLLVVLSVLLKPNAAHGEWNWIDGKGAERNRSELEAVLADHEEWLKSEGASGVRAVLSKANLSGADLRNRDLRRAVLIEADLTGARLGTRTGRVVVHLPIARQRAVLQRPFNEGANLSRADLTDASLNGADLGAANLRGAFLLRTDLRDSNLKGAILDRAFLFETELEGANLDLTSLRQAIFEPASLPALRIVAQARHLEDMRYDQNPAALVELRTAFRRAGYVEQDRKITLAIRRSNAWQRTLTAGHMLDACLSTREDVQSRCDYMVILFNGFSALFESVFFDVTCRYGMEPGRPLLILLAFWLVMSFIYAAFTHRRGPFGIYLVYTRPDGRRQGLRVHARPIRMHPIWKVPFRWAWRELRLFRSASFFSLVSAFNIGFREVNVGNWLRMLMRIEYDLRAKGWARTLSGLQSLVSVYLVALSLLSYFGHPFD